MLLRSAQAPAERTLIDILRSTVAEAGQLPAIDNGAEVLTYEEFLEAGLLVAGELAGQGIGAGDRVGVHIRSGSVELYVAIIGVLLSGAAYVPVDVDDPPQRVTTVFGEAQVAAVITDDLEITSQRDFRAAIERIDPASTDDAWIIFTSGSTGTPKGVAVTHRSAAAFVDAEAHLFLQERPIGPGDRVMAGLSVAFDASCEEMWLAWRYGACLVPAPRSLVKSGADVGPWLAANSISVVSTVPTLVALWPPSSLERVRLLILGGEACPQNLVDRLAHPDREVWNTYGPTEATVVACGMQLRAGEPVRIGLPLDGWDLAIVDEQGMPVEPGDPGELVIGGVGLARYLDPAKDAEKYAPSPILGWNRAYRSGDIVTFDGVGLKFVGRADEQIKLGGRRIELGEIDSAMLSAPGVTAAAAAIRQTVAGNSILVGYVTTDDTFDRTQVSDFLRERLSATSVPRLVIVETLPVRTSGKIDRDALPWPVVGQDTSDDDDSGTEAWLRTLWFELLGSNGEAEESDFFAAGGSSLTAAQLVARLRERVPQLTVADVYENPELSALASFVDSTRPAEETDREAVRPVPPKTQWGQVLFLFPLRTLGGLRWLSWMALGLTLWALATGTTWVPVPPWPVTVLAVLVFLTPPGKILLAAVAVRFVLRGVAPGKYPRGGKVHLRLWAAEKVVDEIGAVGTSASAWLPLYAKLLGAKVHRSADLHAVPPVTGFLEVGKHASIEPEVDLAGHWIDGDTVHIGQISIGKNARIGARSMLMPDVVIGDGAEVGPGSAVFGDVPAGDYVSGAPAAVVGPTRGPAKSKTAPRSQLWAAAYAAGSSLIAALPVIALLIVAVPALWWLQEPDSNQLAWELALVLVPLLAVGWLLVLATLVLLVVRVLSIGIVRGVHAVHSLQGWRAWTIFRVLDEARTWLFPIYASTVTPWWLRLLGAKIGSNVEASTVLLLPSLTSVNDGAFLADDTMLGMYELGGGWLRIEPVKIGRHAFVGNSGMTAPGRKVPRGALVAVLSAAPRRGTAKKNSSWIGSPPTLLRRRAEEVDQSRTYQPPNRVRVLRGLIELARLLAVVCAGYLFVGVALILIWIVDTIGWTAAAVVSGLILLLAGVVAAALASAAKWLLIGGVKAGEHALWSSFVWRNELADSFTEVLAAPWFCRLSTGTVVINWWFGIQGAKVGRGVWCESYWLPEPDLVRLGSGATVNRGCVVQTHLFHDRILSLDTVSLDAGATLGPNSVALPASVVGSHATIGPMSLVMRGEHVPAKTRWTGNPIGPWGDDVSRTSR